MPQARTMTVGNPHIAFLSGGGELGRLIAAFDWVSTSIGPIEIWPQSLKTAVSLILRSRVPIVMLWGHDGVMIYNDGYSEFAGGRHPQLLGSKVREGWPEVADFNDNIMKVCLGGGTLAYREQVLTLNRTGKPEQVWLDLDYSPVLDESGEPAGVIAIVIETTAKVAAERWRTSERDRQRQMFEQAPGFMAMLSGPQHVVELTNAAYMQLVGHRDIIGLPIRQALPEIEGQGFFELLDQVFTSGEAFIGYALKAELQRTPGAAIEDRFIDLVYQPVRNPAGEVFGIFVQGVDVTDRLIAEQALRQSETQFRTFAEAMPNHVWTATPDGLLDWFNPRVYDYSGAKPGELDGHGWADIVHPDDIVAAAEKWQQALAASTFYETEFRLRRHDGIYRWFIARARSRSATPTAPSCAGSAPTLISTTRSRWHRPCCRASAACSCRRMQRALRHSNSISPAEPWSAPKASGVSGDCRRATACTSACWKTSSFPTTRTSAPTRKRVKMAPPCLPRNTASGGPTPANCAGCRATSISSMTRPASRSRCSVSCRMSPTGARRRRGRNC
nr:PAS domain-containing protein [Mesorhizobium sp. AR02]